MKNLLFALILTLPLTSIARVEVSKVPADADNVEICSAIDADGLDWGFVSIFLKERAEQLQGRPQYDVIDVQLSMINLGYSDSEKFVSESNNIIEISSIFKIGLRAKIEANLLKVIGNMGVQAEYALVDCKMKKVTQGVIR